MIEWMCTQEHWNPEVAINLARRHATAGLQLAAVMMTRIRIIQRCTRGRFAPHTGFVESLFFISPRTGHGSS